MIALFVLGLLAPFIGWQIGCITWDVAEIIWRKYEVHKEVRNQAH